MVTLAPIGLPVTGTEITFLAQQTDWSMQYCVTSCRFPFLRWLRKLSMVQPETNPT